MGRILFTGHNIILEAADGTLLSDCIRQAGLFLETPCNCIGKCGKCRVAVKGDVYPPTPDEALLIQGEEQIRMACMARLRGTAEVTLLTEAGALKTVASDASKAIKVDSDTVRRVMPAIEGASHSEAVLFHNRVLTSGTDLGSLLGVAVDIGTTGISACLLDLESGNILNQASCLNPQARYGSDVLSRISYCMNHETGAEVMKETVISGINGLVRELLQNYSSENKGAHGVYRMTVAGNTTMLHFLVGANTRSIAHAPYTPVFIDRKDIDAPALDLGIDRHGVVTLLPSASGYVGADILSGVVATAFDQKQHPAIFIDIGTNGEIVAVSGGRLAATSTAAGPALEGMNISCGCRAEAGAIDTFEIDADYGLHWTTIGGMNPKGICGSGLIDLAACLVRKGIVLPSGKFNPHADERIRERIKDKKFHITEGISLSQKDIRQIQLAKGAIAAGVSLLLEEIGVPLEAIEEAVIAGSFGYHINPESLLEIGLIPKGFRGSITFAGNSSVEGARMALLSKGALDQMTGLQETMSVLELSTSDRFQEVFVRELGF